jgi:hypothetical protein
MLHKISDIADSTKCGDIADTKCGDIADTKCGDIA